MAMPAGMVYEFRASASNNNGGGFKDGGSGTDHSLQDAAEYNNTDLVIDGADDTKVTSATHNFVASDVDNIINITAGVGFTPGRYHITAAAGNAATLDRACGSTGSTGGTYYVGGALALPIDAILETFIPGNKAWMEAGTYTLSGAVVVAVDGTAAAPIVIEGYNSSRGDDPTGTDRPLIVAAANTLEFDNYWIFKHLRGTTTASEGFRADNYSRWINCKMENTSGSAFRHALHGNYINTFYACEAISGAGHSFYVRVSPCVVGCYAHDSGADGVKVVSSGLGSIVDNIIETCAGDGIELLGVSLILIKNNTIYNNGNGISATTANGILILNNIIASNTVGAIWTTEQFSNIFDYNDWHNNGTDTTKATKGDNALAVDPQFTDAPNGNFTIGTNLKAQGFPGAFPGGLVTGYIDVGAAQREEAGGAASGVRNPLGGPI